MRHNNTTFSLIAATLAGLEPQARDILTSTRLQGEDLVRIASDETVVAPFSGQLTALDLLGHVDAEVADFLSAYLVLNGDRNRKILKELEAIAFELNQIGIEPVVLKGSAYLLTKVYVDPAQRFLLDIDLLVSRESGSEAFECLVRLGYRPETTEDTALARDYHFPPLDHPDRVRIELHTDLGHGLSARILPFQAMHGRSTIWRCGRAVVRVPAPNDLVAHLVMHSQLHHGYDQRIWPPLRAMYDLLLLTRRFQRQLQWPVIRDMFSSHRKAALLDLHMLQTAEVFKVDLPYPVRLDVFGMVRRFHRRLLWRWPWLRYVDPVFAYNSAVAWRMRLLPKLIQSRAGRRLVFSAPFRLKFYRNLLSALNK